MRKKKGKSTCLASDYVTPKTLPKSGAGLRYVRGQSGPFMKSRGDFSNDTTGTFQPELTQERLWFC